MVLFDVDIKLPEFKHANGFGFLTSVSVAVDKGESKINGLVTFAPGIPEAMRQLFGDPLPDVIDYSEENKAAVLALAQILQVKEGQ